MPVERMRMRPWLEEQINSCKIPGLKWVNREKKIFQIPWMHAARHGWDVEKDAPLFRNWAIHTGKYQPGVDKPDPKTWKANFRCAMNSLPDIEEVKDKSIKKGTNAFRVYKMLSASERQSKRGKKRPDVDIKLKEEQQCLVSSAWESTNGSTRSAAAQAVKQEADHTVTETEAGSRSPSEDHLIIPEVCQTIEVVTENEEQAVSSSHSYPLQISPMSSYGESETDSVQSEEDSKEHMRNLWGTNPVEAKPVLDSSAIRTSLPSMSTFITQSKPNFRITTVQDTSSPPFNSPFNSERSWNLLPTSHPPSQPPAASGTPPIHEKRASVIMKTSDVSKSVKSY
ncbi:interferon regulatory factor 2 isoform 2-T2 [Clarias gariepinus]|nr:interferon regulatory factor 2 isoform X2 [Clarias gariepinus]